MDDTNRPPAADEPFFNALLTPHRSLGRTGFTILMGTLVFGWLATGALFLSQGAWPVFGFFGLDVLAGLRRLPPELSRRAGARGGVGVAHRARHPQDRAVGPHRGSTASIRSGRASRLPAMTRSASPGWQVEAQGKRGAASAASSIPTIARALPPPSRVALATSEGAARTGAAVAPRKTNSLNAAGIGWRQPSASAIFGAQWRPYAMNAQSPLARSHPPARHHAGRRRLRDRAPRRSKRSASTIATSLRWRRWPRRSARRRPACRSCSPAGRAFSPKAFLQAVTLDHARRLLDDGMPLLETSYELGMSGPGRLHDLFVTHEAMSPGDYKTRGAGLTIRYGFHISPFGVALIMVTDRGLAGLSFNDAGERARRLRRHELRAGRTPAMSRTCRRRRPMRRASSIRRNGAPTSRCASS